MEDEQKIIINDMFEYYKEQEAEIFAAIDKLEAYHLLTRKADELLSYHILDSNVQHLRLDETEKCLVIDGFLKDHINDSRIDSILRVFERDDNADISKYATNTEISNSQIRLYGNKKKVKLIINLIHPRLLKYSLVL